MTDWTMLAKARGLDAPAEYIERISASLEALDEAWRRAAAAFPHETEPAYIMYVAPEGRD